MYVALPTPERSFRRSRDRSAVFVALRERGRATLGELASVTGVEPGRVWGVLVGAPPSFSVGLSLVGLGLARAVLDVRGEAFEVTELGVRLTEGGLAGSVLARVVA